MGFKDLIVTPIILLIVYFLAYIARDKFTDKNTRGYFIPALTVKIIGALALGFLYQFYYDGGDTFNLFHRDSRLIWEALMKSPVDGLKILLLGSNSLLETYEYSSRMISIDDLPSLSVVRIAGFFSLFTGNAYSANAILFACFSFVGSWALFQVFYRRFLANHFLLAISVLFVPSVAIWGSGILKDTITLGALGFATYAVDKVFLQKESVIPNGVLLIIALLMIFYIKKYILLCFVPAAIIWLYLANLSAIKSIAIKLLTAPMAIAMVIAGSYFAVLKIGEGDRRYALENLAQTAQITAYDIRYWTGREAGSGYTLGELDGTYSSLIRLAPKAVNVSLFRPFLWEVNNVLMLFSSLESSFILIFTLWLFLQLFPTNFKFLLRPEVLFCLVFSITFAFAVGVSTFNFGSLARYKIPLIPFYLVALTTLHHYVKRERKSSRLALTEY